MAKHNIRTALPLIVFRGHHFLVVSWIVILISLLNACIPVSSDESPLPPSVSANSEEPTSSYTEHPDMGIEQATPDRYNQPSTKVPERIPLTEAITPVTSEVPRKILDAILMDLEQRIGEPSEKKSVIQAQAIVWNDGSLGCSKPGEFYTMATVTGYWVIIEVSGRKYDYRAAETGYFFLCEGGLQPITPPHTPGH